MILRRYVAAAAALCAFGPVAASAQEKGRTGIFMGYPSLGLIWHASETVAVRPEISFSHASTETDFSESDNDSVGVGVTLLFYMAKRDNAAAYFAPRYAYSHTSVESEVTAVGPVTAKTTSTTSQLSASFGAQYWMGKRFSVFGEAGLSYTTGEGKTKGSPSTFAVSPSDLTAIATRASVAAVFYF